MAQEPRVWEREELLTGCAAVSQAVRLADVDVIAAYPIRPYTEVMDILWTIQEIVFDMMLPWRTELPEDVESEGDDVALAGFWREFRLHP